MVMDIKSDQHFVLVSLAALTRRPVQFSQKSARVLFYASGTR